MKTARVKNVTLTLNTQDNSEALKLALKINPEAKLSALIRQMIRAYIAKGGKI